MEKSHVTLEQRICQVCAKAYDTGSLLLDRRLKPVFDMNTVTGYGMCSDCAKLDKDDYIALVGIDPSKSTVDNDGTVKNEDAYRTGSILHIRRQAAMHIFNVPSAQVSLPLWFVEEQVISVLKERAGI